MENVNSIDQLLELYRDYLANSSTSAQSICDYLVEHYTSVVLRILQTEANIPSKFDLMIVSAVSKIKDKKEQHNLILEIYSNRKE